MGDSHYKPNNLSFDKIIRIIAYPYHYIRTIGVRRELKRLKKNRAIVHHYERMFRDIRILFIKDSICISSLITLAKHNSYNEDVVILIKWATNSQGVYLPNRTIKHILMLMDSKENELNNKLNY